MQLALRVRRTYTAAQPVWGRRWRSKRLTPLRWWCDGVEIVIASMIRPAAGCVNQRTGEAMPRRLLLRGGRYNGPMDPQKLLHCLYAPNTARNRRKANVATTTSKTLNRASIQCGTSQAEISGALFAMVLRRC